MSVVPTEVHLREAEGRLNITWSDGSTSEYSLAYLRGWCPCAGCQGHFQNEMTFVTDASTTLTNVEPIGGYAMRPVWADGHKSGIFSFQYLRELAVAPPPRRHEGVPDWGLLPTGTPSSKA